MLVYFPEIYPSEVLYSVIARYHRHVSSMVWKHTAYDLFGRTVPASVDLPGALGALCECIPPGSGFTPEGLARDCTLYPYYTAFKSKALAKAILRSLVRGPNANVHMRAGFLSGDIRPPTHLRFCPTCCAEMLEAHGELYWRRDHQLPGVLACPRHGTPIADSTVKLDLRPCGFVAAHAGNCCVSTDTEAWATDPRATTLLQRIACSSAALLTEPPQYKSVHRLAEEYRKAVHRRGFDFGVKIDQGRLMAAYLAAIGPVISLVPGSLPGPGVSNWLAHITGKSTRSFHPLLHVIFRIFLEDLPLQPQARLPANPFGRGPWPCRNRLAGHHGQAVVTEVQVHRWRGRAVGRFICSCGCVYTLAEGPNSKPLIRERGPLFDERLRCLLASGSSICAAARALAVFPETVQYHAERLGLVQQQIRQRQRARIIRDRHSIRTRWLAVSARRPDLSRRELAGLMKPEYRWLCRNDKAWLNVHFPPRPAKERVDLAALDCELAAALTGKANELRQKQPPQRITLRALERQIGLPHWISNRKGKLPQTTMVLNRVCETAEDFYLRRIPWGVAELKRQGFPVISWRLLELTGQSRKVPPLIEAALAAAVENGGGQVSRSTAAKEFVFDGLSLTHAQWKTIEPHCSKFRTGRHPGDERLFLEAVLWIARTGAPWRKLAPQFGPWRTNYKRFLRWLNAGVFERIFDAVSEDPSMEYAMVNGRIVRVSSQTLEAKRGLKAQPKVPPTEGKTAA